MFLGYFGVSSDEMKKKELISIIQSLNGFRDPKIELEQYTTDAVTTLSINLAKLGHYI
jgi:hypothetical protein